MKGRSGVGCVVRGERWVERLERAERAVQTESRDVGRAERDYVHHEKRCVRSGGVRDPRVPSARSAGSARSVSEQTNSREAAGDTVT